MNFSEHYSEHFPERIHNYLDGVLDHADEADLLGAIAQSEELRDELRHAIALKAAFKADVQTLAPPPQLTNSIFANLGFVPSSAANQGAAIHQAVMSEAARTSSGNAIFTGIVSSVLTAIVLLSWTMLGNQADTQGNKQERALDAILAERNSVTLHNLTYLRIAPAPMAVFRSQAYSQQGYNQQEYKQQRYSQQTMAAASWLALTQPFTPAPELQIPELQSKAQKELPQQSSFPPSLNAAPQLAAAPMSEMPVLDAPARSKQTSWLQRVQIQTRRIVSMSLPSTDFPSNPSSFLRNTALGMMFKVSEQHSVGIECSEETYYQIFQEQSLRADVRGGFPATIQQNPSLFWAGMSYRYALLASPEHGFNPFVQGLLGGTQLGATGRAMLGLSYSPDAKTEFTFGLESSALVFLHQGVLYASPKLGFTYGVSLRF